MIYDRFVEKIVSINKSNHFEKCNLQKNPYNNFYNFYNPKGVEFLFHNNLICMISYDQIKDITLEYSYIGADFVFALSNGDPYFVKDKKVYSCCHGEENPDLELLAQSFERFLEIIVKGEN